MIDKLLGGRGEKRTVLLLGWPWPHRLAAKNSYYIQRSVSLSVLMLSLLGSQESRVPSMNEICSKDMNGTQCDDSKRYITDSL